MKTEFTKRKWKILWGNYTHFATINTDSLHRICAIEADQSKKWMIPVNEQAANAKLIASAPDLFEALKEAYSALQNPEQEYLDVILNHCEIAIKKATE